MKKLLLSLALASLAMGAQAANVQGSASAVFDHPTPLDTVYSGIGTDTFNWGSVVTGENRLSFSGSTFSAALNTPFKLGSFSYSNGTTVSGSNPATLDFTTFMNFTQPSLPVVAATFRLGLNGTTNTRDPRDSSDYVNFQQTTTSSQFIIGGVAYTVRIAGFQHVTGDGFLTAGGKQFHVKEGGQASVDLYGVVTTAPVPEAETWALMLGGLGILSLVARRRKPTRLD